MDHHRGDHGGIDHGGGMHDGTAECAMNMVWNTSPANICLVFPFIQIGTSTPSIVGHLLFVMALAALYEHTRLHAARLDRQLRIQLRYAGTHVGNAPRKPTAFATDSEALLSGTPSLSSGFGGRTPSLAQGRSSPAPAGGLSGQSWGVVRLPWSIQTRRSLTYVANVALSFYLMLLVMSYNAQVIGAVLAGAFIGHLVLHRSLDLSPASSQLDDDEGLKGAACH